MAFNEQGIINDPDFLNYKINAVTLDNYWNGNNLADLVENIPSLASKNKVGKLLFRVHKDMKENVHGLINFIGGYFQPHKHGEINSDTPRREGFRILRGSLYVILFDNDGIKKEAILLDANDEKALKEFIIPTGVYHTVVAGSGNAITYELKEQPKGGYIQALDKDFLINTPTANSPESKVYFDELLKWAKEQV